MKTGRPVPTISPDSIRDPSDRSIANAGGVSPTWVPTSTAGASAAIGSGSVVLVAAGDVGISVAAGCVAVVVTAVVGGSVAGTSVGVDATAAVAVAVFVGAEGASVAVAACAGGGAGSVAAGCTAAPLGSDLVSVGCWGIDGSEAAGEPHATNDVTVSAASPATRSLYFILTLLSCGVNDAGAYCHQAGSCMSINRRPFCCSVCSLEGTASGSSVNCAKCGAHWSAEPIS